MPAHPFILGNCSGWLGVEPGSQVYSHVSPGSKERESEPWWWSGGQMDSSAGSQRCAVRTEQYDCIVGFYIALFMNEHFPQSLSCGPPLYK